MEDMNRVDEHVYEGISVDEVTSEESTNNNRYVYHRITMAIS